MKEIMKEKIIEFIYPEGSKELFKDNFPIPAKLNIPDWYKKLESSWQKKTIKSCMPFLDSLSAGYILKLDQDFYIKHNFINEENNKKDSSFRVSYHGMHDLFSIKGMNLNSGHPEIHPPEQLGEKCPFNKKNIGLSYYKILNPYTIKTPPGYSCLFVPLLNNNDDRFEIISGIVDTDTFEIPINFPIIINGDKYPTLETVIKRGTPYVQVIPFKRDKWKMKTTEGSKSKDFIKHLKITKFLWNNYKNLFWNKKKWS